MAKIFVIMGKSSTGKDTIFKRLIMEKRLSLKVIVCYTTRPMRSGETNGVEYFFVDDHKMHEFEMLGKVIERRSYSTLHGVWNYFTVDDGQIDILNNDYIFIDTLEGFKKLREFFGTNSVVPIYIEVSDRLRLRRALDREDMQQQPKYAEMCRRFLADESDFSDRQLKKLAIHNHYTNENLEDCLEKIVVDIQTISKKSGKE